MNASAIAMAACDEQFNLRGEEQQQTILNSFDFLNEINQFKNRLDTLEKERYELEEKVRRLQEENTNYKNRFIKENNQWIGSRSILALSGHTNLSAFTGNKCFMM
ncbi:unnamed protein product [Rotaria sp. Silwood2]|nr:unnamed protein product [Rotaria sp. Silwood2]CAF3339482.1 unnamed protein product [Rotaria sp. Silwood2]